MPGKRTLILLPVVWFVAFLVAWGLLWLVVHWVGKILLWLAWPVATQRMVYIALVTPLAAPFLPGIPLPVPILVGIGIAGMDGPFSLWRFAYGISHNWWAGLSMVVTAGICWLIARDKFPGAGAEENRDGDS